MAKSKYEQLGIANRLPEIEGWARDGYRDEDIAKALGISRPTLYAWRDKYPEFAEVILKGKAVIDAEVENKLLTSAMGHVFWEETQELCEVINPETNKREKQMITVKKVLKYIKPEVAAQIFWLKNRKSAEWRDKQQIEHSGGIGVSELSYMSDEDLEKAMKEMKGE